MYSIIKVVTVQWARLIINCRVSDFIPSVLEPDSEPKMSSDGKYEQFLL